MIISFLFFCFFIYEEVLYKLFTKTAFHPSFLISLCYIAFVAFVIGLLMNLLPKKTAKHVVRTVLFLFTFWYGACILMKNTFGIVLSVDALTMADQVTQGVFLKQTFIVIFQSWYIILSILLPFIGSFFIKLPADRKYVYNVIVIVVSCSLFFVSLHINEEYRSLYFDKKDNVAGCEHFGVVPSLFVDLRKNLTGFEEKIIVIEEEEIIEEEEEQEETVKRVKQISDIDFMALSEKETKSVYKDMDLYFNNEIPTFTNEYTGMFEGKNLIYIMGESFDSYAVSKELTPTLYKMLHEGFYFRNFYSPTSYSTIGGEFALLTGMVQDLSMLSAKWRAGTNYYPYGLANIFKDRGYFTYAYHDYYYDFQDRNIYLKSLGFDNYLGCGNGIENRMDCSFFPEYDSEMIESTYEDYIHDDRFMVYYVTVSAHMDYYMGSSVATKHYDKIKDLQLPDHVKGYVAGMVELDEAMERLLTVLEENGRLEDTVIVMAADHHPYALSDQEMKQLAGKDIDSTFELYHNGLVIYNSEVEHTEIEKVGNTIDVLPTTLNLFGIPYDSCLIIGKDLLATGDGLVLFGNGSWMTNKGKYSVSLGKFIPNDPDMKNIEAYVSRWKNIQYNRRVMSKNIMNYDYYRHLFIE